MENHRKDIKELINGLPEKPGVYQFFDETGNILYVGKAKNLKKRVSSYFTEESRHSGKTIILIRKTAGIRHIIAANEWEALLLENSLIKKYQPRYNIQFRDDKTYPWICIKKEPFPRVFPTRRLTNDGSEYYGPYPSGKSMNAVLGLLKQFFKFRTCPLRLSDNNIRKKKFRVCLEYHIGNCFGPCEGLQDATEYNKNIAEARSILKGNVAGLIKKIKIEMKSFSERMEYEEAQKLKVKIDALEHFRKIKTTIPESSFELRTQRMLEQIRMDLGMKVIPVHIECFDNSNIQGSEPVAAMSVFKNGKPSKKDYRHFNIKTVSGPNDYASMEEVISRRYSRLLNEKADLPQLIIVDGGKAQLGAATGVLRKLGLNDRITVISIAKRLEEIYFPGDPIPLHIDKRSWTLKVIQRLRNEAHRFGLTHHRKRRAKTSINSGLLAIDGIGDATAVKLLRTFRSVKKIKSCSLETLAEAVGKTSATVVYNYFIQH